MENNKNKKSVKFQGVMLNLFDFIQVFIFTTNHHLKLVVSEEKCFDNVDDGRRRLPSYKLPMSPWLRRDKNDLTLKKSDFLDLLC